MSTTQVFLSLALTLSTVLGAPDDSSSRHYYGYVYDDGGGGYLSDWDPQNDQWASLAGGRFSQPAKCIPIPTDLTLCRGIGYDQMRLPNLLEHNTIEEVTSQARMWVMLKGVQCHPDTQLFLCSLFAPVCLDRPIPPCRSLCESVRDSCESKMTKYGFPWPEMLQCDQFPLGTDLCIQQQHENKPDSNVCHACSKPSTFEALVDGFCNSDFVVKMKIAENTVRQMDLVLSSPKKKRVYKKGSLKKRDISEFSVVLEGGARCECSALQSVNSKQYYMVMGHRDGKQLVVDNIQAYDRRDRDMKQALRAIRKDATLCEGGMGIITVGDDPSVTDRRKDRKTAGRKEGEDGKKERRGGREEKDDDVTHKDGKAERRDRKKDGRDGDKDRKAGRDGDRRRKEDRGGKRERKGDKKSSERRAERKRAREESRQSVVSTDTQDMDTALHGFGL